MGGDRTRDRGSGRERQRERGRRGGERRDHSERVVEDSSVGERFDLLESRLESTAALASSSAFRVGNESSRRSLVYFVQGDLKTRLERKWATWQRNAALPVQRRPKEKPTPWKLQVYTEFLDYVKSAMATGPSAPSGEAALEPLLQSAAAVEAANHGPPQDGRAWPIVLVFRNSENGQATREHWLLDQFRPYLGKEHELGVRPARYMVSGVHRKVTDFLPGKGGGKGSGKRSPKRESEGPDRADRSKELRR